MKYLLFFFTFVGGCALLYLVPSLIRGDGGIESQQRIDQLEQTVQDGTASNKALAATLESLVSRVESLETRLRRQPIRQPQEHPASGPANGVVKAGPAAEASTPKRISPDKFKSLLSKVLRVTTESTATEEEQQRFWQAARTTSLIADTIKDLEAHVAASPQDNDARMQLGDAYVAKLLTVPAGPERGIWGMKAEKQWQTVVKHDPDHWEAQYTLAYNYSMYPDFLNKTDDAIKGFERTLKIQERVAVKPGHAKTYVQLARMHGKKGDTKKARAVLELGRQRHPGSQEIGKALQALPGK